MAFVRHCGVPFLVLLSGSGSIYSHGTVDRL